MRLAICAREGSLDSLVDSRFGRCACFVVVDTDREELIEVIVNENSRATGGAGPQSAKLLAKKGVNAVVAGNFGPKAVTALNAAGINIHTIGDGKVKDVMAQLKE